MTADAADMCVGMVYMPDWIEPELGFLLKAETNAFSLSTTPEL